MEVPLQIPLWLQHPGFYLPDKKEVQLIVLGGIGDGSYKVPYPVLLQTDLFISGGISSNCEFEFDVHRQVPFAEFIMLDASISRIKLLAKGFGRIIAAKKNQLKYIYNSALFLYLCSKGKFIKKFLGSHYTLHDVLKICICKDNILLKLDIEGSEYDIFSSITDIIPKINMLVMEMHDLNEREAEARAFLENLSGEFAIVHTRINPSGGSKKGFPNCIEFTIVKRALIDCGGNSVQ